MKRGSMTVVIVYIILVISAFITIFFISPTDEFKIYSLPLLALAAVTGTALVYWAMNSTHFKLNKKLSSIGNKKTSETAKIEEEIKRTDAEIDVLVYKLYGLTPEEIKIVEESLK